MRLNSKFDQHRREQKIHPQGGHVTNPQGSQVIHPQGGQVIHPQGGQVIVEYVLLMVIAVAMAALLTRELVNRSVDNPGILVQKWNDILKTIGDDIPDKK